MHLADSVLATAVAVSFFTQAVGRSPAGRIALRCSPNVVSSRDTIELHAGGGRELGVRTPDGRFLFLAFVQETSQIEPTITPSRLRSGAALSFKVSDALGAVSTDRGPVERVFKVPGRYRFVVSDNLETEDDLGVNGTCDVALRP
jgi:hypothetical protein